MATRRSEVAGGVMATRRSEVAGGVMATRGSEVPRRPMATRVARPRTGVCWVGAVLILGGGALLSACGASGTSQASAAPSAACQRVSAVLSNGPDPTADPVGYAEAQIQPLGRVSTTDTALRHAISALDAAYRDMFATDGSKAASRAVSEASARMDAICPGAAP